MWSNECWLEWKNHLPQYTIDAPVSPAQVMASLLCCWPLSSWRSSHTPPAPFLHYSQAVGPQPVSLQQLLPSQVQDFAFVLPEFQLGSCQPAPPARLGLSKGSSALSISAGLSHLVLSANFSRVDLLLVTDKSGPAQILAALQSFYLSSDRVWPINHNPPSLTVPPLAISFSHPACNILTWRQHYSEKCCQKPC